MAVKVLIGDGKGTGDKAFIEDNALMVSQFPAPPLRPQKTRVFRRYLTDDGTISGSENILVDGSSTSVDFWINSNTDSDLYVTFLNIVLAYPSASAIFAEFADDGAALTNGIVTIYRSGGIENTGQNNLVVNGDIMRLSTTPNLVETRSLLAVNDYGFVAAIDLKAYMPPYGIKLDKGSKDRYILRIQDNLVASNATLFNCIAYGFTRFE